MVFRFTIAAALAGSLLMLGMPQADAQSYRCVSKDGRKYYGQTIPRQCIGQPVEQLNSSGLVIRRIDPQASKAEQEEKAAEEKRKREEELAQRETLRRNRALLATYTSVKDIEDQRERALADNDQAIKEVDVRIEQLRKQQARYKKDLEFYKDKNKIPAKLRQDMRDTEVDLEAQQGLRNAKQKEVEAINAKYDADKKQFVELTTPKK